MVILFCATTRLIRYTCPELEYVDFWTQLKRHAATPVWLRTMNIVHLAELRVSKIPMVQAPRVVSRIRINALVGKGHNREFNREINEEFDYQDRTELKTV